MLEPDALFWLGAAFQAICAITGLMVTKSEDSAPTKQVLTVFAVLVANMIKIGPLGISKNVSIESYMALLIVTVGAALYIRFDRSYVEQKYAEQSSMYEQQGGGSENKYHHMQRHHLQGYSGDWEWDTADEDEEAMKHLLA